MDDTKITFNVDEDKFFEKCVKHKNIPSNDALKQILLKRIMHDFEKDKVYTEQEINAIIKQHFEDFTFIRRELINFGYMQKDPTKGEYWVIKKKANKI